MFSKPGLVELFIKLSIDEVYEYRKVNSLWNFIGSSPQFWKKRYDVKILQNLEKITDLLPEHLKVIEIKPANGINNENGYLGLLYNNGGIPREDVIKFNAFSNALKNIYINYPDKSWMELYHIAQHIVTDYFKYLLISPYIEFSDLLNGRIVIDEDNYEENSVYDHYIGKMFYILMDMDVFVEGHNTKTCQLVQANIDRFSLSVSLGIYEQFKKCDTDFKKHQVNTEYIDINYNNLSQNNFKTSIGYSYGILESFLCWLKRLNEGRGLCGNRNDVADMLFSHVIFKSYIESPFTAFRVFEYDENGLTYAINTGNDDLLCYMLRIQKRILTYNNNIFSLNKQDQGGFTPLTTALIGSYTQALPDGIKIPKRQEHFPTRNFKQESEEYMKLKLSKVIADEIVPTLLNLNHCKKASEIGNYDYCRLNLDSEKFDNSTKSVIDINLPNAHGEYPIFLAYAIPDKDNSIFNRLLSETNRIDLNVRNKNNQTIAEVIDIDSKKKIKSSIKTLYLHRSYTQYIIAFFIVLLLFSVVNRILSV